ncbi:MAG TPA: hypothetical protein VLU43_09985 [Anaeromyxobacteraceae bacterium]|nr:hypothetical protein [Anaeromyxobacteraceae bacterium]
MPHAAVAHRIREPQGWDDRVARARSAVAKARSLDDLADLLNSAHFAALPLKDLVQLPTFGGERPGGTGIFSWDAERVLVMDELGEGFRVVAR